MSLQELKKDWDSIGESDIQNKISNEKIKIILKTKYRPHFYRVLIFETLILFVYLYFIALTIFRFDQLEINYLETLASISIVILILLFILRLVKLINIYRNGFLNHAHSTVLKKLAKQNIKFQRIYLFNIVLGFLLMVFLIILSIKIYNEYDLIQSRLFWLIIIPGSFIFILLMREWIVKHYVKAIREAEDLLKELE